MYINSTEKHSAQRWKWLTCQFFLPKKYHMNMLSEMFLWHCITIFQTEFFGCRWKRHSNFFAALSFFTQYILHSERNERVNDDVIHESCWCEQSDEWKKLLSATFCLMWVLGATAFRCGWREYWHFYPNRALSNSSLCIVNDGSRNVSECSWINDILLGAHKDILKMTSDFLFEHICATLFQCGLSQSSMNIFYHVFVATKTHITSTLRISQKVFSLE